MTKRRASSRTWYGHLWREFAIESWKIPAKPSARPEPAHWDDGRLTAAWLGHSTVLINFFGIHIITDPVLFSRVGVRLPGITIGPKRLIAPALRVMDLPPIDLIVLSHAHFDHFDLRTLHRFDSRTFVVTARRTADLLRSTRLHDVTELQWGETTWLVRGSGSVTISAFRVNHWGARVRHDNYRGYNGYVIERENHRIIFGGDTAYTERFAKLRDSRRFDLAIMAIGAYDPWIRWHATPEQAVAMANAAGAHYIMPVHHQTFQLSFEPARQPIERFEAALGDEPQRIALREIGETFTLPR